MIIGVDGGALSITDERLKVGVFRVTLNLVKELSVIDKTNEYRLYSFIPIDNAIMRMFGKNVRNVVVKPSLGWASFRLPLELLRHPVDVFLGLSQMLPNIHARRIGFVYDVGFLHHPRAYPDSLNRLIKQTKQVVDRSDHIVCISKTTQTDIMNNYRVSKHQCTVAYPGIDARFRPEGKIFAHTRPYFLSVGALKRIKNIPFALQIFTKFLKQSSTEHDFILIGGDYWPDPRIRETITKLHIEKYVKCMGYIPDDVLPAYYRGATALLIPSLIEGFCLPAVEAMACGCPIIASNTGSLPEIMGDAGIYVNQSDIIHAADMMMSLTKSSSLRSKLRERSLKQARKFSWKQFASTVHALILTQ